MHARQSQNVMQKAGIGTLVQSVKIVAGVVFPIRPKARVRSRLTVRSRFGLWLEYRCLHPFPSVKSPVQHRLRTKRCTNLSKVNPAILVSDGNSSQAFPFLGLSNIVVPETALILDKQL